MKVDFYTGLRVRAQASPWWNNVEFLIRERREDGSWGIVRNLISEEHDPKIMAEPTFRLSREASQILMDDLWASGIRPSEALYPQGALKAMQAHLKDLQRLVFEKEKHERRSNC